MNSWIKQNGMIGFWLFLGSLCWTACAQTNSEDQSELLTVAELKTLIQEDPTIQLVDVRTPEEYAAGHLEGAVNIDYKSSDFATELAKVDANRPTVLYCAKGGRSHQAYLLSKDLKFKKLYDLDGGYSAWIAEKEKAE